jgi:hypothetical protein
MYHYLYALKLCARAPHGVDHVGSNNLQLLRRYGDFLGVHSGLAPVANMVKYIIQVDSGLLI